jgi:hypothetical protein
MLVFNLTKNALVYRRRTLPPNGGSFNFLDLRVIPLRDQKLAQGPKAILSFGSLPAWFKTQKAAEAAAQKTAQNKAAALQKANPKKAEKAAAPVEKKS